MDSVDDINFENRLDNDIDKTKLMSLKRFWCNKSVFECILFIHLKRWYSLITEKKDYNLYYDSP